MEATKKKSPEGERSFHSIWDMHPKSEKPSPSHQPSKWSSILHLSNSDIGRQWQAANSEGVDISPLAPVHDEALSLLAFSLPLHYSLLHTSTPNLSGMNIDWGSSWHDVGYLTWHHARGWRHSVCATSVTWEVLTQPRVERPIFLSRLPPLAFHKSCSSIPTNLYSNLRFLINRF